MASVGKVLQYKKEMEHFYFDMIHVIYFMMITYVTRSYKTNLIAIKCIFILWYIKLDLRMLFKFCTFIEFLRVFCIYDKLSVKIVLS